MPFAYTLDEFEASDFFVGPPATDAMIRAIETKYGYKLPEAYKRLVKVQNGGALKKSCCPSSEPTSWHYKYAMLEGIRGVGDYAYTIGYDEDEAQGEGWGYPNVGLVFGETPTAGHTVFMLDYSECGPQGEPRIIDVDTESAQGTKVVVLAPTFAAFLDALVDCAQFDED